MISKNSFFARLTLLAILSCGIFPAPGSAETCDPRTLMRKWGAEKSEMSFAEYYASCTAYIESAPDDIHSAFRRWSGMEERERIRAAEEAARLSSERRETERRRREETKLLEGVLEREKKKLEEMERRSDEPRPPATRPLGSATEPGGVRLSTEAARENGDLSNVRNRVLQLQK